MKDHYSNLKRPSNNMPQDVEEALEQHGLMDELEAGGVYMGMEHKPSSK